MTAGRALRWCMVMTLAVVLAPAELSATQRGAASAELPWDYWHYEKIAGAFGLTRQAHRQAQTSRLSALYRSDYYHSSEQDFSAADLADRAFVSPHSQVVVNNKEIREPGELFTLALQCRPGVAGGATLDLIVDWGQLELPSSWPADHQHWIVQLGHFPASAYPSHRLLETFFAGSSTQTGVYPLDASGNEDDGFVVSTAFSKEDSRAIEIELALRTGGNKTSARLVAGVSGFWTAARELSCLDRHHIVPVSPPLSIIRPDQDLHFSVGLVQDPIERLVWDRCLLGQEWFSTTCHGQTQTFSFREALSVIRDMQAEQEAGYVVGGPANTLDALEFRLPLADELLTLDQCYDTRLMGGTCDRFPGPLFSDTPQPEARFSDHAFMMDRSAFYSGTDASQFVLAGDAPDNRPADRVRVVDVYNGMDFWVDPDNPGEGHPFTADQIESATVVIRRVANGPDNDSRRRWIYETQPGETALAGRFGGSAGVAKFMRRMKTSGFDAEYLQRFTDRVLIGEWFESAWVGMVSMPAFLSVQCLGPDDFQAFLGFTGSAPMVDGNIEGPVTYRFQFDYTANTLTPDAGGQQSRETNTEGFRGFPSTRELLSEHEKLTFPGPVVVGDLATVAFLDVVAGPPGGVIQHLLEQEGKGEHAGAVLDFSRLEGVSSHVFPGEYRFMSEGLAEALEQLSCREKILD